jgi:hypothetical protein
VVPEPVGRVGQPTCRDGIAANSLVRPPRPFGALASPDHQPHSWYFASVSTKPGNIRGGAVGNNQNPTSASSVAATSVVRARAYCQERLFHSQTSTTGVTR